MECANDGIDKMLKDARYDAVISFLMMTLLIVSPLTEYNCNPIIAGYLGYIFYTKYKKYWRFKQVKKEYPFMT